MGSIDHENILGNVKADELHDTVKCENVEKRAFPVSLTVFPQSILYIYSFRIFHKHLCNIYMKSYITVYKGNGGI